MPSIPPTHMAMTTADMATDNVLRAPVTNRARRLRPRGSAPRIINHPSSIPGAALRFFRFNFVAASPNISGPIRRHQSKTISQQNATQANLSRHSIRYHGSPRRMMTASDSAVIVVMILPSPNQVLAVPNAWIERHIDKVNEYKQRENSRCRDHDRSLYNCVVTLNN